MTPWHSLYLLCVRDPGSSMCLCNIGAILPPPPRPVTVLSFRFLEAGQLRVMPDVGEGCVESRLGLNTHTSYRMTVIKESNNKYVLFNYGSSAKEWTMHSVSGLFETILEIIHQLWNGINCTNACIGDAPALCMYVCILSDIKPQS